MFNPQFDSDVRKCIKITTDKDVECGFRFSNTQDSEIVIGGEMNVFPKDVPDRIGVFHTHSIIASLPSEYDVMSFRSEPPSVSLFCYAFPTDESEHEWKMRCYDRSMSVVHSEVIENE